jgi:DNA-binding transcriptional LysR family regulator
MKLHQLRYLVSVADSDLNITAAAKALHTSQPGVSKQLKMLEDELGFRIFVREGRALVRVTPPGEKVIARARHIVREIANIRGLAAELRKDQDGSLSIATTHTQARYVLPAVLKRFRQQFPGVRLHLQQGTSEQIAEMLARDRVDVALDPVLDADLRVRSAAHLFEPHTTWLGFRRGALLRSFGYEFIAMVAPHLTRRRVQAVEDSGSQAEVDAEFADVQVPFRR